MSKSDLRFKYSSIGSLLILFFLSGCVFRPLYQNTGNCDLDVNSSFFYKESFTNLNYKMINAFRGEIKRLSHLIPKINEKACLKVSIKYETGNIIISESGERNREQTRVVADYKLSFENNKDVYSNSLDIVSSYCVNDKEKLSNMLSRQYTEESLAIELAKKLIQNIASIMKNRNDKSASKI